MKKTTAALSLLLSLGVLPHGTAQAKDQIQAVGSSTVYPFVAAAAEQFGRTSGLKTPIVESTGTGGGLKLFCAGAGDSFPDLANASRSIKTSEIELCNKNGVKHITEIKIGFDGIVFANKLGSTSFNFTKEQLFQAIAKKVPVNGQLVDNPNKNWNDIDPSFPAKKIELYGPPPTSGTRDALTELVLEKGCVDLPEFKQSYSDEKARKEACHLVREDGHYIEAGENDNLIVQKLINNPDAVGIFGYSFLEQNEARIQGNAVENVSPTFETVSSQQYPVSRTLYVYAKDAHFDTTKGLRTFIKELISDKAIGENGYLVIKGLIPLPEKELAVVKNKIMEKM